MNSPEELPPPEPVWYCLRTGPRQEETAVRGLARIEEVETFLPRIRFRRATRRGPVWFTEPLFPRYLFARYDRARAHRWVAHTHGVTGWVHFGEQPARLPPEIITRLRAELGEHEIKVFDDPLQPGDKAVMVDGPLRGLEVVVHRVLPAPQRVAVLMEFLGQEIEVELDRTALAIPKYHPLHREEPSKRKGGGPERRA
jgi:transcriptional antiterminator RfaH